MCLCPGGSSCEVDDEVVALEQLGLLESRRLVFSTEQHSAAWISNKCTALHSSAGVAGVGMGAGIEDLALARSLRY